MNKKRIVLTIVVILVLAALTYLQFRTWRSFNWHVFFEQTREANLWRIASAVLIIYGGYFLRALRWQVMLRPIKNVSWRHLISPTFIGFTALAVLGRPGELIRPYLIARKERLPVSSQMAVWTVERIFDMGCFAILVALDLIFAPSLQDLPYFREFRRAGFVLIGLITSVGIVAFLIWRNGPGIAASLERWLSPISTTMAKSIAGKVRAFGKGLHTIRDLKSFAELVVLSLGLWLSIAFAYLQVTRAYPEPLRHMQLSHIILLMGFSIAGSAVQLPVIGGGSQLMTIVALEHVFEMPHELALSCGILLWLVTFVSSSPIGLLIARREHVNLVKLSEEAEPA
ncbi:MAG: hypothetical protein JWN45_977 [Acidobacteriaceae bacterium]|nr:hypothetical protein [Acidobacteriaceae bacterium]